MNIKKRQLNVRISVDEYAALEAMASIETTELCPCCQQEWKAPEEYKGEAIATLAAKLLSEAIRQKAKN